MYLSQKLSPAWVMHAWPVTRVALMAADLAARQGDAARIQQLEGELARARAQLIRTGALAGQAQRDLDLWDLGAAHLVGGHEAPPTVGARTFNKPA